MPQSRGRGSYYWQVHRYAKSLSKPELEQKLRTNVPKLKNRLSKEVIIDALYRIECGKLCYDVDGSLTRQDLERFIKDRSLVMPSSRTTASMTSVLKQADENACFDRFTDLAPELREHVYEFYIAALGELPNCPSQPPLARTCRSLRQEFLPVFYKNGVFTMKYEMTPENTSNTTFSAKLLERTQLFLSESIPPSCDGLLQRVVLEYGGFVATWLLRRGCTMRIELCRGSGFSLKLSDTAGSNGVDYRKAMEEVLNEALRKIDVRDGKRGLRADDIFHLFELVKNPLKQIARR